MVGSFIMEGDQPPSGTDETGSPVDLTDQDRPAQFFLAEHWKHRRVPRTEIVTYDEEKGYHHLQYTCPIEIKVWPDKRSMVVVIIGRCDKGKLGARAKWLVSFGPVSPHNCDGLVSPLCPQTTSRAEIEALSKALDKIKTLRALPSENEDWLKNAFRFEVTFLTYSEDLCRFMSMPRIEAQVDGKPVAHFESLKRVRERMDTMIKDEDGRL